MLYNRNKDDGVRAGSVALVAPLRLQDLAEISSVLALLAALLYRHFRKKYLLRSQRQWAETLDSVTDCILVHDDAFRIIRVNRALRRRLGRHRRRAAPSAVRSRFAPASTVEPVSLLRRPIRGWK